MSTIGLNKTIWESEQDDLKKCLILADDIDWQKCKRVAGVDISFVKGDSETACAGIVVLTYPELKVLHEEYKIVKMVLPYIPGFLAFREVKFLKELIDSLDDNMKPDIVLVDGNGFLHPRGFGLACHLGVICNIPTIGIGKNFLCVDEMEIEDVKKRFKEKCTKPGDTLSLIGKSGTCWGAALKTQENVTKPIFISQGHKLSLPSSIEFVMSMCKFRLPEPIRYADIGSRNFLRKSSQKALCSALRHRNVSP
jgi:endonuclease V